LSVIQFFMSACCAYICHAQRVVIYEVFPSNATQNATYACNVTDVCNASDEGPFLFLRFNICVSCVSYIVFIAFIAFSECITCFLACVAYVALMETSL